MKITSKFVHFYKKFMRRILKNKWNRIHLTGAGLASFCDLYISDEKKLKKLNSDLIRSSEYIFIKSEFLLEFLKEFVLDISGKTILSGNSDVNFTEKIPEMNIPRKLYMQNLGFQAEEQIKPLPIGLENYEHVRGGFAYCHKKVHRFENTEKILVPPMSDTNPIRIAIKSNAPKIPIYDCFFSYRNFFAYKRLLKRYQFVLVCEGNGFDTHRLWEVLYQGSFPVVLNSAFVENLQIYNLPLLVIEKFEEPNIDMLLAHKIKYKNYNIEENPYLWLQKWERILRS